MYDIAYDGARQGEHAASGAIACTGRSFLPAENGGTTMYFIRIVGSSDMINSARAMVLPTSLRWVRLLRCDLAQTLLLTRLLSSQSAW